MKRPTHKEISNKIRIAKEAVANGWINLVEPSVIILDAFELGYFVEEELPGILSELLSNSSLNNYTGGRPPQQSYEVLIEGLDLFAFIAQCDTLSGEELYYKYAIKGNQLYLVSLHKNRK